MTAADFAGFFVQTLQGTAADIGVELLGDAVEVRAYTAERMQYLADRVDDDDFLEAVEVESINVLLMAAGAAVTRADAIDDRLKAVAKGLLGMAARALGL